MVIHTTRFLYLILTSFDAKTMIVPLKFCFGLRHLERLEPDPCARQCPARNQMVCARCQHGVFRTFMSPCHLRQHQCRKRKDRIELVARRPCESTGLYFEPPRPVVAVAEPEDSDPVLEYIYSVMDSRPHVTINQDKARDSKRPQHRRAKIHRTKAGTGNTRIT